MASKGAKFFRMKSEEIMVKLSVKNIEQQYILKTFKDVDNGIFLNFML